MQKDYDANASVSQPVEARILDDSPPPRLSIFPAALDHSIAVDELSPAKRPQYHLMQAMSPPTATVAPSSHDDTEFTESLLRGVASHASQLFQLRTAVQTFLRRYHKLAPLLEAILLQRSEINHLREQGRHMRRFIDDSQEAFLSEAQAIIDALPADISLEKLRIQHDLVLRDHERRKEHVSKIQDMETNIADCEYVLQGKEHRLAQSLKRIIEILDGITLPDGGGTEPPASSTVTEASKEEYPSLVQHYFDKFGNVTLSRERLFNLEQEHLDARAVRRAKLDVGRPPSIPEEDFEKAFSRDYQEAEAEYTENVRKAELAKAVCIGEGLNPDDFRKNPSETQREGSHPAPSDAAVVSDTDSNKLYPVEEVQIPTYRPIYQPLIAEPDSSIYPPWPRPRAGTTSPVDERVQTWLQNQSDPWEPTEARKSSFSGLQIAALDVQRHEDDTLDGYELASRSRKQKRHLELPPMVRRLVDGNNGEEQPVLLRRSSSESELFVLALQHNDREDTFKGLRGFTLRLP